MTSLTRGSSARQARSSFSSRATFALDSSEPSGSRARYSGTGSFVRAGAFARRDWPAAAMARVALAASSSAAKLISSE